MALLESQGLVLTKWPVLLAVVSWVPPGISISPYFTYPTARLDFLHICASLPPYYLEACFVGFPSFSCSRCSPDTTSLRASFPPPHVADDRYSRAFAISPFLPFFTDLETCNVTAVTVIAESANCRSSLQIASLTLLQLIETPQLLF